MILSQCNNIARWCCEQLCHDCAMCIILNNWRP